MLRLNYRFNRLPNSHHFERFGKQSAGCIDGKINAYPRESLHFGSGVLGLWVYDCVSSKTFGRLPAKLCRLYYKDLSSAGAFEEHEKQQSYGAGTENRYAF